MIVRRWLVFPNIETSPSDLRFTERLRQCMSRQSRPPSLRVPALTLRRVTWQRISFSEPLVCSGSPAGPAPSATRSCWHAAVPAGDPAWQSRCGVGRCGRTARAAPDAGGCGLAR